jgi:hypothetical protein|tara:strand:- start:15265 stop:16908 length:1644 start_codon:yes stop_codon:yes gene_type:complete
MSYGTNGSVIGPDNAPTASAASGVWSLGEIAEARRDGVWPEPPTGFILLWGDPDDTGGVNAECYPYAMGKLSNGTSMRLGTRWNSSNANSSRIASGTLDFSGFPNAPTTMDDQHTWNWTFSGSTPSWTIYTEDPRNTYVDSSDNMYQCGAIYDASYSYYQAAVRKFDSSQAVQWNVVFESTAGTSTGLANQLNVIKTASGYPIFVTPVYGYNYYANKPRMQMLLLSDTDGSVQQSKMCYDSADTWSAAQANGPFRITNPNGDKFAYAFGDFVGTYQTVCVELWSVTSTSMGNEWALSNANLKNNSSSAWGGNDCYVYGSWLDSSNNVWLHVSFASYNLDSSGTKTNSAIVKYDSSGNFDSNYLIIRSDVTAGYDHPMYPGGIIGDNAGNIYVSGYSMIPGGSVSAPFIAKIDVSGATPSMTWITQAGTAAGNNYAQNIELVGSDMVVSMGYGTTPSASGTAVVGTMVALNTDGETLGSSTVDGQSWSTIDLSPYVSNATTHTSLVNQTGSNFTATNNSLTQAGDVNTWIDDVPATASTAILVESGGI